MGDLQQKNLRILSRDAIKYIAAAAMLLNHIANVFMKPGTLWFEVFCDIGYLTAPVMCYFLVEGYQFTRSKKKYAQRLFAFAVLSQFPFYLAMGQIFSQEVGADFCGLNMLFTLLICFGILWTREQVKNIFLRYSIIGILILCSTVCDWAVLAPVYVLLFVRAGKSESRKRKAFAIAAVLFGGLYFLGGVGTIPLSLNLLLSAGNLMGPALAGILILFFYNGQKAKRGAGFSKWFFYVFYPVHLLVLGIIRVCL